MRAFCCRPALRLGAFLSVLLMASAAPGADFILGLTGPGIDDAAQLQALGWDWERVPLRWSDTANGGDAGWAAASRKIRAARTAGMRVQLTLSFGWPRGTESSFAIHPSTGLPADETGRRAMQSFLQEAFTRFGAQVDAIGVEDDLSAQGFPGGPAVYAQLLTYVSSATRSVLPNRPVIFGAVDFNTMERDQRMFFVSDTIRALGAPGIFDGIELRLAGENASSDYRRIPGAYNHLAGQIEGTPYEAAQLLLITDSPARGEDEQASDLVRRTILAAERGFDGLYWDGGLSDSPGRQTALASAQGRRKSFATAFALGRMTGRFDFTKSRIDPRGQNLNEIELAYRTGGSATLVWRDYFAAGQSYEASENVALKTFEIEGPYRKGLLALPLVPAADGILHGYQIMGLTFDLGGAPILLSQNYDMLREIGGAVPRPIIETPTPAVPTPVPPGEARPLQPGIRLSPGR